MASTTRRTPATGCPSIGTQITFDVAETDADLAIAVAEPVAVTGELAELSAQLEHRGIHGCANCSVVPLPGTD
jgi:hypothetical protein